MDMDQRVKTLHNNNLQGISNLKFINDQIRLLKKMVTDNFGFVRDRNYVGKIQQRFSELQEQVKTLKSRIIKEDSKLLSSLCMGCKVDDKTLEDTCKSPEEVKSVSLKFRMLKKEVKQLLLGNRRQL